MSRLENDVPLAEATPPLVLAASASGCPGCCDDEVSGTAETACC
jgi:hypothetical protein